MRSILFRALFIGMIFFSLPFSGTATEFRPDGADVAEAADLNNRGMVLYASGDLQEAEFSFRASLERAERVLGDDDPASPPW